MRRSCVPPAGRARAAEIRERAPPGPRRAVTHEHSSNGGPAPAWGRREIARKAEGKKTTSARSLLPWEEGAESPDNTGVKPFPRHTQRFLRARLTMSRMASVCARAPKPIGARQARMARGMGGKGGEAAPARASPPQSLGSLLRASSAPAARAPTALKQKESE